MAQMSEDIRAEAAKYYDVNPTIPDDRAFYQARLPSSDATVLELGCGTGRVLLPLAAVCGFIHGIDRSPAMLARCLQKVQAAAIPPTKARVDTRRYHRLCPGPGLRSDHCPLSRLSTAGNRGAGRWPVPVCPYASGAWGDLHL